MAEHSPLWYRTPSLVATPLTRIDNDQREKPNTGDKQMRPRSDRLAIPIVRRARKGPSSVDGMP